MKRLDNIEQRTDEWHQFRKGKITGTVLKSIMGTPYARGEMLYEFIGDVLAEGIEDENENAMDRGNRLESEARAMFMFERSKIVEETGGCIDEKNPRIANSPDGLIGENEAIEIKCMGRKNHVKLWLTNSIPQEYYWQVIQYFVVNPKLEKLYFVGYHPEIKVHPMHIIEVTRQSVGTDILMARNKEEAFLNEVDEILSKVIEL